MGATGLYTSAAIASEGESAKAPPISQVIRELRIIAGSLSLVSRRAFLPTSPM
jgi:hypothetical protein